jgi:hypothetical protein
VRLDELGYADLSDSFAEMKIRAQYSHFNFPYLYDGETQSTSRKYGPTATPQVFIFDRERKLRYQGRLDSSAREALAKKHDARDAIDALLAGTPAPAEKTPTFGCSIKWAPKEQGRAAELARIEQEPVKVDLLFGTTDNYGRMAAFDAQWNAGVPYTVLLAPDGKVVYQHQGPVDPIELRRIGIRAHWKHPLSREQL